MSTSDGRAAPLAARGAHAQVPPAAERQLRWDRDWIAITALSVFVVAKLIYPARAVLGSGPLGPRVIAGADSALYLSAAQLGWFSKARWAGEVPIGYPLLIKVVAGNWRAIVVAQSIISAGAWSYLALAARTLTARRLTANFVTIGLLATGLAASFQVWDVALATESLSLSLLCATIASALLVLARPSGQRVALFLCLLAFAALTRDTNAILAALVGGSCLVAALRWRSHRRLLLIAAVSAMVIAAAAVGASGHGRRWYWQVVDVTAIRIVGNRQATAYFTDRGLPISDAITDLHDHYSLNQPRLAKDPAMKPFLEWVDRHGRATYYGYLATHPGYVVREPLRELQPMLMPNQGGLGNLFGFGIPVDAVTSSVGSLAFPEVPAVEYGWLALSVLGLVFVFLRRSGGMRLASVAATLFLLAVVHLAAVYHGDALELGRHSVALAGQVHIAVILTAAAVIESATRKTAPA